ncbi:MAG: MoaD/ThiS family protein [Myxococcales bacterium]|nr:MoaD/ThiS family protein [Myxococcales bacterium]
MPGRVTVLAFAGARDVLGVGELTVPLALLGEPLTAGRVVSWLCEEHPDLMPYRSSIRLAVNGSYVPEDEPVHDGDEVALIPPVAGG